MKTPIYTVPEYALMLFNLYFGNKELALAEVFEAAKTLPAIPNTYWREVFLTIQELKS